MSLEHFHPIVRQWFGSRFAGPTPPQAAGWPHIARGEHVLIAAPTGSGKTLTAFLAAIDGLLQRLLRGELTDGIRVVYVSPLRALSNDMHRNLEEPLREMAALAEANGTAIPPLRTGLRTGDTSAKERAALIKKPPHILVTTPESLYLLLTSAKGRERLQSVETVIVDEIHALIRDKRGSHLGLTLERLETLTGRPFQRIGLSATQRPIERVAEFLTGVPRGGAPASASSPVTECVSTPSLSKGDEAHSVSNPDVAPATHPLHHGCRIVNIGHQRDLDLDIEVPKSELGAVCMHEQWAEVNARLVELIESHRSTLIFVNTRRMAERVTHQLSELLGESRVSSHHGSLAAEFRHDTEQRLKRGDLKAVVATASLELGLDVGYIDLVIQIGSPRSIATFLQRVGRSGHALGKTPKGRLFALTRDELLESIGLLRAVSQGRLDTVPIPVAPLDILAQQVVAELACGEWNTDELFDTFRRAYSYRELARGDFDQVLKILSEGISANSGRGRVYLHHDLVRRRLRARPGARLAAISSGGAIPEIASYRVVAEPERTVVGTLDEDFASESQAGEIFLLGNTSWRIKHVRGGEVTVTDAAGAPPSIPFWRGEAPGRTLELSEEVSRLRADLEPRLGDEAHAVEWLRSETGITDEVAGQAVRYCQAQQVAVGLLPTQDRIVYERFFDESGGMQLVIHAPFGARINRGFGLALRKRFCRSFDFELQASADDDGVVLSLGPQHSFPLESMFGMLTEQNVRRLLEQSLLAVPTFQTRWRWNVTRALLVLRSRNGKKVPPPLQRFRADDLLTAVFPKLTGCQENNVGDIAIPDHPLVKQSMHDALTEALDIDGLQEVLRRIDSGQITQLARDTREPSPFSYELLNANPYAFLDGGEVAERRARAVATRRSLSIDGVDDLGRLDPEAIALVRQQAQPFVRNEEELHDVLLSRFFLPVEEVAFEWTGWLAELSQQGRVAEARLADGTAIVAAVERWPAVLAAFPDLVPARAVTPPPEVRFDWEAEEARVAFCRGLLEVSGPVATADVAARLRMKPHQALVSLEALEGEGVVLRGRFTPEAYRGFAAVDAERVRVPSPPEHDHDRDAPPMALNACGVPLAAIRQTTAIEPGTDVSTECGSGGEGEVGGAVAGPEKVVEWCHRRLLSRIHRLTMEGLRKQIEPVAVPVYLRWLMRHHGLGKGVRRIGPNGLLETIGQLEGFDLPAVVWERDVLPVRFASYRPEWLDELCLTGEVGWGRLYPPQRLPDRAKAAANVTRVVPVALFRRADVAWLRGPSREAAAAAASRSSAPTPRMSGQASLPGRGASVSPGLAEPAPRAPVNGPSTNSPSATGPAPVELSSRGQQVWELLKEQGAMFAGDLATDAGVLPTQLNDILGELVTLGLVTADGFAGLRHLVGEKKTRRREDRGRTKPPPGYAVPLRGAGRWSLFRVPKVQADNETAAQRKTLEQWAWLLLNRWGVVFRDLLERETGAPRWFELLSVYRRLEARGEIRGGRFIAGVAGEQFAHGDTVRTLRAVRDECEAGSRTAPQAIDAEGLDASPRDALPSVRSVATPTELVVISAADPLNLVGILTAQERVPSMANHRVAILDGQPVAAWIAGSVKFLVDPTPELQQQFGDGYALRRGVLRSDVSVDPIPDKSAKRTRSSAARLESPPAAQGEPSSNGTATHGRTSNGDAMSHPAQAIAPRAASPRSPAESDNADETDEGAPVGASPRPRKPTNGNQPGTAARKNRPRQRHLFPPDRPPRPFPA